MKNLTYKLLILTIFLSISFSACKKPSVEIEYTILPTSLSFNASGGEDEFTVSVKSPAIVESVKALDAWCHVFTNGVSPVNVIVRVDPHNNTNKTRNTSVVVNLKLDEIRTSATVQISQAGEWVLIDGIKWATCNVDAPGTFAAKPEASGMFYQWNKKVGWSATDPMINSNGGIHWDYTEGDGNTWEKVNDPCPQGWRVPTIAELQSLARVANEWTIVNDVNGYIFGDDNDLLFLPAAGSRYYNGGAHLNENRSGLYWSSGVDLNKAAFHLVFRNTTVPTNFSSHRAGGYSVRCVQE